ncbi:MAG TPA: lasso peptide biosynthesis B2 protein [Crinalium sp.]|jgi:hypothetical protein
MKRLFKSLYAKVSNRYLLLKTLVLLNVIRLGLWLLPFQRLLKLIAYSEQHLSIRPNRQRPSIGKLVWLINTATHHSPGGAKCLARALVAKILFTQFGYSPNFKIGVAKGQENRLEAHAWIEYQGRVVIGHLSDLSRFIPLPSLEGISL